MTRKELLFIALHQATEEGVGIHLAKFADICIEWATNEAVDKACEWLDDYLTFSVAEWDEGVTTQRVIDKFRKAMKSGSSEKPNNCEKGGEE